MTILTTSRLQLVPATLELLAAELASSESLASRLGAVIPNGWPPGEYDRPAVEYFRAQLAEHPENTGWYGWYAIQRDTLTYKATEA